MNVSINPWYYCNFRCGFCYLTEKQLSDRTCLDLKTLDNLLSELQAYSQIQHIDIYGGEVALLPVDYWNDMTDLLLNYTDDLNLVTNLSVVNDITRDPRYTLSVSYDFEAREKSDLVYRNMSLLERDFSVLMLASPALIKQDVEYQIQIFNLLPNLSSVEIKPYSRNQANQLQVSDREYERFVEAWIESPTKKNFTFVNEYLLEQIVQDRGHSFSDDHVYITPQGQLAVLEFDDDDREFFLSLSSVSEYIIWCKVERNRVKNNHFCGQCQYLGRCLSEHLREVKSISESCNGYIKLIEWYRDGRTQDKARTLP